LAFRLDYGDLANRNLKPGFVRMIPRQAHSTLNRLAKGFSVVALTGLRVEGICVDSPGLVPGKSRAAHHANGSG
jgi:hypothetical protein